MALAWSSEYRPFRAGVRHSAQPASVRRRRGHTGAGVARVWRGRGTGMACDPRPSRPGSSLRQIPPPPPPKGARRARHRKYPHSCALRRPPPTRMSGRFMACLHCVVDRMCTAIPLPNSVTIRHILWAKTHPLGKDTPFEQRHALWAKTHPLGGERWWRSGVFGVVWRRGGSPRGERWRRSGFSLWRGLAAGRRP
eukprot:gene25737-biopygen9053